ncbi:unnamed protein product [Spirodela intermedia]|uniref:Cytochrome b5 heme-binding domain-containing protein n=1 Tax=Spirodela intermedia TaxID=51605 RepID=A0A7I8JCV8_SPIIN|nr:unnamed protein product [Spirodela intermedia]CAA6667353.1 unnamed protein product [Spirodela intermedia]
MPTIVKLFSPQETSQHDTREDCWIIVDGKVYDVTEYLDDHPGGDDIIVSVAGKDATEEFEDAGHSKTARELMKSFCVGEVDPSPPPPPPEPQVNSGGTTSVFSQLLLSWRPAVPPQQLWVVAAAVAVAGVTVAAGLLYSRRK